jgi:hypothetical protein
MPSPQFPELIGICACSHLAAFQTSGRERSITPVAFYKERMSLIACSFFRFMVMFTNIRIMYVRHRFSAFDFSIGFTCDSKRAPNVPNPSIRTMALGLTQPLTELNTRKPFWGIKRGRRLGLTISPPSVSRLFRKCWILDVSQPCRP